MAEHHSIDPKRLKKLQDEARARGATHLWFDIDPNTGKSTPSDIMPGEDVQDLIDDALRSGAPFGVVNLQEGS